MNTISLQRVNPVARAAMVIGAVMALVTGITFAALTSTATLTNNTISSATADLQVSADGGTTFGNNVVSSFNFSGIVPGGAPSANSSFKLKNNGTGNMSVALMIPAATTFTVTPSGTVDKTKVDLAVACTTPTLSVTDTLANLEAGNVAVTGTLAAGETADCTVNASMDADAFTGSGATSSAFTLQFTGTAI